MLVSEPDIDTRSAPFLNIIQDTNHQSSVFPTIIQGGPCQQNQEPRLLKPHPPRSPATFGRGAEIVAAQLGLQTATTTHNTNVALRFKCRH